jgi:hypothetical protein
LEVFPNAFARVCTGHSNHEFEKEKPLIYLVDFVTNSRKERFHIGGQFFLTFFSAESDFLRNSGLPDGYITKPKIPILVNFGGLSMENDGLFYGHLVDFTAIWYFLLSFGTFFHVLVCCTKKNLATLPEFWRNFGGILAEFWRNFGGKIKQVRKIVIVT